MGLEACPLESLLIVVYLTLRLSGTANTSVSLCSTKRQSTEEKKKNVSTPKGEKKSEIKTKKRKTYKSYLGFHSKQILYPTYKILPKTLLWRKHSIIKELKNLWWISCRFVGLPGPAVIKLTEYGRHLNKPFYRGTWVLQRMNFKIFFQYSLWSKNKQKKRKWSQR